MSAIPLHLAAFDGDNDIVNRLLTEGANVDTLTNDAETPLLFAAMNGHTATVRTLLKWGADGNRLPTTGDSALRQAIKGGHAEIVRLLLDKGADPSAEVPARMPTPEEKASAQEKMREMSGTLRQLFASLNGGETPLPNVFDNLGVEDAAEKSKLPKHPGRYQCLIYAIRSRSLDTLKVLLEAGYSPLPVSESKTPLLLELAKTIGTGLDMVRLLLEHGADPNGNEEDAISPLQHAVMLGDLPYARLLIEYGAKTEPREPGMSLLTYAIMRESREMVEFLLDKNIGVDDNQAEFFGRSQNRPDLAEMIRQKRGTSWLSLVKVGDVDGVKTALQNGADVNAAEERDGSALMIATETGNVAMVRLLLEAGANPNYRKAHSDLVPIHVAATKGTTNIASTLVEYGADIYAKTSIAQTAIYRAALAGHANMADLLVEKGARISVVEAILLHRFDITNDMWANGTPVDYQNESGVTALHAAVAIKDTELIHSLIQRGAVVDAKDRSDHTPLLFAIGNEDLQHVRLLLDNGADLHGGAEIFYTPLHRAVLLRNEPLVRLLLERGAPLEQPAPPPLTTHVTERGIDEKVTRDMAERLRNRTQLLNSILTMHRYQATNDHRDKEAVWQSPERLWAVVRTLLEFGADPNSADDEGNTLLSSLVEFGAPEDLIRYAIKQGANVNPAKAEHKAPLMVAITRVDANLVQLLLIAGANPNGAAGRETPLQTARDRNLSEIIGLLQKHGALDEKREALETVPGLEEMRRFLRPTREEAAESKSPLANLVLPDFSQLVGRMYERRDKRIVERRERLVAEIEQGDSGTAG